MRLKSSSLTIALLPLLIRYSPYPLAEDSLSVDVVDCDHVHTGRYQHRVSRVQDEPKKKNRPSL